MRWPLSARGTVGVALACLFSAACLEAVSQPDGGHGVDGGAGGGIGGGSGGGSGGGVDGGAWLPACRVASECAPVDAGTQGFCAQQTRVSCIAGRCQPECGSARTCTADLDAGCLDCGDAGVACRAPQCFRPNRGATVEWATCGQWPGTAAAMQGSTVSLTGTDCRFSLESQGIAWGTVEALANGQFLADLPALGGVCTGTALPTGVERWAVDCPACRFSIAFF